MFWLNQRHNKTRKKAGKRGHVRGKRLLFEQLEARRVLAGVVTVTTPANNLVLTGDGSDNVIELRQTANPNEFEVTGLNGTLLNLNGFGPFTSLPPLPGITGNITVTLLTGDDTFSFLGAPQGDSSVAGNLTINNNDGSNDNLIADVLVNGNLNVIKTGGTSGRSDLEIRDSEIIGVVTVNNSAGGTGGDTMTKVIDSLLHGDGAGPALNLINGPGEDITMVNGTSQFGTGAFNPALVMVSINNDGGGSSTTFTGMSQVAGPGTVTVYGGLTITNGLNLDNVMETVAFLSTNVLGAVTLNNGAGDTTTMISDTTLGSNLLPVGPAKHVTVTNGAGTHAFNMDGSTTPWGLLINNGAGSFGSTTQVTASSIGTSPFGPSLGGGDAMLVNGDAGRDVVTISDTLIDGGALNLTTLAAGNNEITIEAGSSLVALNINTGAGADRVRIDDSTILVAVSILLDGGADVVEVVNLDLAVDWPNLFFGSVTINGGAGVDTLTTDGFLPGNILNFEP